jgi:hypothetical protein
MDSNNKGLDEISDKTILLGQAITKNGMSASDYPTGILPPALSVDTILNDSSYRNFELSKFGFGMGFSPGEPEEFRSALTKAMQNSEPSIRIDSAGLAKVLADNEFKNTGQSGSTGAPASANGRTISNYNEIRNYSENINFGLPLETPPSERPVYGFMNANGQMDVVTPSDIRNGTVNPVDVIKDVVSGINEKNAENVSSNPDNYVIVKTSYKDQGRTQFSLQLQTKDEYASSLSDAQKTLEEAGSKLTGRNGNKYFNEKLSMNSQSWSVGDGNGNFNADVLSHLSSNYVSNTGHYGDALVTLNDNVLTKSTVTNGDSLDDWWATPLPAQMVISGDPRVGGVGINMNQGTSGIQGNYLEIQMFQHPTTSDIKSVTFTGKQPAPAVTNKLDSLGIPWVVDAPARGSTTATKAVDFLANYKKK